ncbi:MULTISPECIES: amidohydrolase [unclassified Rhodococcus (in: high G+C Gram-positive bacteria)]|uniref:amidohydrolase n=1 Tax=unclassified Rhodococcus (in: high G+C Gram-positive bacteria) TaxID=192944 RepID=UPI00163AFD51|nr:MULTISPECIES: amidohydrolase [unclassified Rhodococcus (in: high G+C Gram-positive bacteria)]MBC2642863.1 amidohydrolase [Rhodococcus sp. 3A]MBC2892395.1 amidohydrolase [Rhodococcus sp. 4CII]
MSTETTHYRGGRIFTAAEPAWAESMIVRDERLTFVGDTATADSLAGDARVVDLDGAFVLPGFIDAHTHLLMMGQALQKVDLQSAADLGDIQDRIRRFAAGNPDAPRILGRSWLFPALGGHPPTRQMIDAAEAERPVYLDSNDVHSAWVNTAALRELGIDANTPDPIGGRIERDPVTGAATGMLFETAVTQIVWPTLAKLISDTERDVALAAAFEQYLADGVTGAVDMALGADEIEALERALAAGEGTLPLRVAGHWLIERTDSEEENVRQVHEAVEHQRRLQGPWLRMAGIKIIIDGVIDSCTAAMKEPYSDGTNAEPIWDLASLAPVVAAADAAGLQVAMHAIGDEASEIALTALEQAIDANGIRPRRHRMEHLETITTDNVQRLARLGVVASMQPVHADPAIQDNWRAMLGDHRIERAFPWPEMTAAGAVLALGSDAPTAPHPPLPNMYVATTRKSAIDPALAPNLPEYALPMADALAHATRDAAYSCRWDDLTGQLVAGKAADFVVLDGDPFTAGTDSLLTARVQLTVVAGSVRHRTEVAGSYRA